MRREDLVALAKFFLAICAVGVLGAAFAIAFRAALQEALRLAFHEGDILSAFRSLPVVWRVLVPVIGGLASGVLGLVAARRAGGHGVAEILEAVALGRGQPSIPMALLKGLGSFSAIVSGSSVGREGPIVQFGSGVGALVGGMLKLTPIRIRALVAAGTAAGFAAAYDAPIAATLFVLEIVTGLLALEVLLPVLAATSLSTYLTRLALGETPLYGLRTFRLVSGKELVVYALLGILAGLLGPAFMAALDGGDRLAKKLPIPRPVRGALGGLIVGALAVRLPEICGNGSEAINLILDQRFALATVALLLVAKMFATVTSVSSGSPGGVFTPSLFLGAALGSVLEGAARSGAPWLVEGAPGAYALVGMAGLVAATTHAPLMATALVFELSADASLLPPLLLATALATTLGRRLRPNSIYTEELARRGIPWRGNIAERLARAVRASDILQMDPPHVAEDTPIEQALSLLERGRTRAVYVVGGQRVRAIDLITAKDIWSGRTPRAGTRAGDVAVDVPNALASDNLVELSERLWNVDIGEVPVVEPGEPASLLGIVTRRDVLGAFDREVLQRDVLVTRVVWFEGQREAADFLELPRGQRVELIAPPKWLVDRLVDIGSIHQRFQVTVLGLRLAARGEGPGLVEPDRSRTVRRDDRLLVKGEPEAIQRFRASAYG